VVKPQLEGIFTPHITPFTRDGDIDEKALRTCVKFWVESGISGLIPCGSNGEAPYLSREERKEVIEIVIDEANGKMPVIPGTGSMSTRETVLFTQDARDLGADAALVVTPFYFKLSNRELYEHYRAVIEAVDLPILVYNVPKFTGFSLEPVVISQLASEYDNVIGVKESSGNINQIAEIIRLVGKKISVLAGTADVILPTLTLGGKGAVVAVANVAPKVCVNLYKAFREGNEEEAKRLQLQVSHLNEVLVKKYNQLSAIKEALNMLGWPVGYPRRPALPLDEEAKEDIKKVLGSYLS